MTERQCVTVMVTAPSAEAAESLVTTIVEERLAACGNIVAGITSIYRWEGRTQRDTESLILFKTTGAVVERLVARVAELHPYDVPEVLVLPVIGGSAPYLAWVETNTAVKADG